jgi:hypothetical protein
MICVHGRKQPDQDRRSAARCWTLIDQPYGHVEYQVTKEKVPHFQVDAPLLATMVKGAIFSVDAGKGASSVTVSEGRVEARNRVSGVSASVGTGQKRRRGIEYSQSADRYDSYWHSKRTRPLLGVSSCGPERS